MSLKIILAARGPVYTAGSISEQDEARELYMEGSGEKALRFPSHSLDESAVVALGLMAWPRDRN